MNSGPSGPQHILHQVLHVRLDVLVQLLLLVKALSAAGAVKGLVLPQLARLRQPAAALAVVVVLARVALEVVGGGELRLARGAAEDAHVAEGLLGRPAHAPRLGALDAVLRAPVAHQVVAPPEHLAAQVARVLPA